MRDIPLNMLRAFAAVYETGGIRPAGRRLGVAHSAISRHLRELEAWIEVPLFEHRKNRRTIVFSTEGEFLGNSVLTALAEMDAAVSKVRESKRANSVTISTTPSFAVRWLLPRLPSFEADCPGIEVSVVVDQRRKQPHEEGADISVRMGSGPWPDVLCLPLMGDRLYPVMSPQYWEKSGRPGLIEDLSRLRLLHDRDPNASWGVWKQSCSPFMLDVRRGSRFTSSDLVLRAAEQGMGVALARERLAIDSIRIGTLIRPFDDVAVELKSAYWLILNEHSRSRLVVRKTIDWLVAEAERST